MNRCKIVFVGLLTIFTGVAQAAFNVQSQKWPTGDDNPYGNARLERFERAITGTAEVPEEDRIQLARQMPFKEKDKLYLRIRLNNATHELKGLSNETDAMGGINQVASATLREDSIQDTRRGVELAIGTRGESWRWDIELVLNRNLDLEINPPFQGGAVNITDSAGPVNQNAGALNSSIENNALLGNFYYEFLNIHIFQPYVVGSFGLSVNRTSTTNNNGLNGQSVRKLGIAYGAGVGTRFPLYRNFSFDVGYRLVNLGSATLKTAGSVIELKGRRMMSGVSCGLIIFLG